MYIKKSAGKVFGAKLSRKEHDAMMIEIQRQIAEADKKNALELDAMVLWALHQELGWGPKRLRRFFDRMRTDLDELIKRYEMEVGDSAFICTQKLKEIGADVEAWYKEEHLLD